MLAALTPSAQTTNSQTIPANITSHELPDNTSEKKKKNEILAALTRTAHNPRTHRQYEPASISEVLELADAGVSNLHVRVRITCNANIHT